MNFYPQSKSTISSTKAQWHQPIKDFPLAAIKSQSVNFLKDPVPQSRV